MKLFGGKSKIHMIVDILFTVIIIILIICHSPFITGPFGLDSVLIYGCLSNPIFAIYTKNKTLKMIYSLLLFFVLLITSLSMYNLYWIG